MIREIAHNNQQIGSTTERGGRGEWGAMNPCPYIAVENQNSTESLVHQPLNQAEISLNLFAIFRSLQIDNNNLND